MSLVVSTVQQNQSNAYVRATVRGNAASTELSEGVVGTYTTTETKTKISMNQTIAADTVVSGINIASIPTMTMQLGGNICSFSCETYSQGAYGNGVLESGTYERIVVKQIRVY